jgi:alpha-ribazole phosphatase
MAVNSDRVTTIDMLRHGACEGGDIYRGRIDVALSAAGRQQMEAAIAGASHWQRIVTSPLQRCREFAERCAERFTLPLQVIPQLQEISFGEWEGRLQPDVWDENPRLVNQYYENPETVTPPGGESVVDAMQRVVTAWDALLKQHSGEHLLLVCHGGVIRLLLSHLLAAPLANSWRWHIPYASLSRVTVYHHASGDFPVLMALNSACPSQ